MRQLMGCLGEDGWCLQAVLETFSNARTMDLTCLQAPGMSLQFVDGFSMISSFQKSDEYGTRQKLAEGGVQIFKDNGNEPSLSLPSPGSYTDLSTVRSTIKAITVNYCIPRTSATMLVSSCALGICSKKELYHYIIG